MAAFQEVVSGVRTIRAELNVPQKARPEVLVRTADSGLSELLRHKVQAFQSLAGTDALQVGEDLRAPAGSARQILTDAELFVPLAELIDVDAERSRLHRELDQVLTDLERAESKLADPSFLKRAPADVVEKEQRKKAEFTTRHERLQANLAALGG
jgi:valyl-tRNA synthetase